LQWGDFFQSFGLEDVAVSAGLWVVRTSVEDSVANNSFQLISSRLNLGGTAEDYIVVPFAEHSLGVITSDDLGTAGAP